MHLESSNESEVRRQALAKMRMSRSLKTNDKVRVMLLEGQLFQERYAGQYLNSQKYELIAGDRGKRQILDPFDVLASLKGKLNS